MQSQGCTQEWNPLQEHVGQNGNYSMDHECYPHMTIFYIFIYILFSPGNEARIHRCHYPSARFCLLPRRQEYCILKVSGLLFFLITNDLRRSDHSQLPWVEVPKTCFLERFEIQVQRHFISTEWKSIIYIHLLLWHFSLESSSCLSTLCKRTGLIYITNISPLMVWK